MYFFINFKFKTSKPIQIDCPGILYTVPKLNRKFYKPHFKPIENLIKIQLHLLNHELITHKQENNSPLFESNNSIILIGLAGFHMISNQVLQPMTSSSSSLFFVECVRAIFICLHQQRCRFYNVLLYFNFRFVL